MCHTCIKWLCASVCTYRDDSIFIAMTKYGCTCTLSPIHSAFFRTLRLNWSIFITRGCETLTIVLALREDDALLHIAAPSTTTPNNNEVLASVSTQTSNAARNNVPYI